MVSTRRGRHISLTPDDLYSRFIELLPLLSPNAMTWYFPLVILFFNALSSELQEAVQLGGYSLPDLSTLLTSTLQEQALQHFRNHAVVSFKTFQDETRLISKLMFSFGNIRNSSGNNL